MESCKRIFQWLNEKATKNVNSFGAQYDAFSVFIFIFFLANPIKWHVSGPYSSSTILILRIIAVSLWLILLLWRFWPKKLKTYLPLFWHLVLIYHLPFRTTFSLLYSQHSPSFDSFGLLGIVALALLVNERIFCILTLIGTSLGCIVYFTLGGLAISSIETITLIYAGLMVVTITFIKLIFFRNHNLSLAEKITANKIFAGAIAHEIRTPISTIIVSIDNHDLETVKLQAQKTLSIVDSVLKQIKYFESDKTIHCISLSINASIAAACNDPYFSEQDRTKIKVELPKEYWILAEEILLSQIIINILKNALWAIRGSNNGRIKITAEEKSDSILIAFTDTGVGIDQTKRKQLFEPFLSSNRNGTGIGLAFCKLALKSMGGSIECDSKNGGNTRFIIRLKCAREIKKEVANESPSSMPIPHYNRSYR